ncbi:hypothetical protein [Xenorhabdus sp. Sc-CR9]|uniref:hypothetical protein n=1 Tax=Xenorhabdus sp. Sc-CR9 TaxID=2584468 RepID=UPI001F16B74F|nr:hypothetical protein [Xenorhabdus sp. Sc-CR9]
MQHKINSYLEAVRFYEYHKQYLALSHNMGTEWHRYLCIQLSVSFDYSQLKIDTEWEFRQVKGFIIASNIKHRLHLKIKPVSTFW